VTAMIAFVIVCYLAGIATGLWLATVWLDRKPPAPERPERKVRYVHGQLPVVIEPPKPAPKEDDSK